MEKPSVLIVLVIALLFTGVTTAEDVEQDNKKLQGTWDVTAAEQGGESTRLAKGVQIVFKDDKITFVNAEKKERNELSFKLDPSQKPKGIEMIPLAGKFKGQTGLGIYALDGDTLKLCYADDPEEAKIRPKEFASRKGSKVMLIILKKVKE